MSDSSENEYMIDTIPAERVIDSKLMEMGEWATEL